MAAGCLMGVYTPWHGYKNILRIFLPLFTLFYLLFFGVFTLLLLDFLVFLVFFVLPVKCKTVHTARDAAAASAFRLG